MKAINKFFYALLAFATVGMVACSEDATHEPGPAELEGCYGVYFPEASVLESQGPMGEISLDPSEATVFKYYAYRENTEGEITVPVEINSTLDAEEKPMYTVEPIVFADGEDVAEFTVTLSDKAEVGVPYKLTVSVANDPQYVKQYDTNNATEFSVTINRVKWIEVGQCLFVEDMVSAWYGLNIPPYEVKVEVRADSINEAAFYAALEGTGNDSGLAGIYRMVNPYEIWGEIGGISTFDTNLLIYVLDASRVYIPFQKVGITINDGSGINDVTIISDAAYDLAKDVPMADIKPEQWGYVRNGKIGFPVDMLLGNPGGSANPSSLYYANRNGLWSLTLSPALGTYELVMPDAESDGDFSFNKVELPEGAMFYSESQATASAPLLEKGRCEVSTKDADRTFYAEYGVLYRLPNLYAEGYPIYFAAKADGTVTLPKNYLVQNTGLTQSGVAISMAIDAENSKIDPATGLLTLVAEFIGGSGDNAVSYGNFQELIAVEAPEFPVTPMVDLKNDFAYAPLFSAPLTSQFKKEEYVVTVEKGVCVNLDLNIEGDAYRLPNLYTNGYDIYFLADSEGQIGVTAGFELQPTGVNIFGKPAYMQIMSGTCDEKTIVLKARICDIEGNDLLPALCTEKIVNYTWNEVATGSYSSARLENPVPGGKLYNAEGTNMYRIENFMGDDTELNFTWDKTTNKCESTGFNDTGVDSALFGGVGNIYICDFRTFYEWIGYSYSWADLAAGLGQDVQPYFDAEANEFVFFVQLTAPELGVGMTLGEGFIERFKLDGAPSEGPKWVEVATGSYFSTLFTEGNYYVPFEGRKLMNLENTNEYRIVNFTDAGTDFHFTWDPTTNKCEINDFNDTGVDSAQFGGVGNIFACDVRSFFKSMGHDFTWEQVAATIGGDAQPFFDAQNGEFVFYVVLAAPEAGVGVALGGGNIYTDYFVLDAQAATANAASKKISVAQSANASKFSESSKYLKVKAGTNGRLSQSALKATISKSAVKINVVAPRTLKSATPVKRQTKVLAF